MGASFIKHFFDCKTVEMADSVTGQLVLGATTQAVGATPNTINLLVRESVGSLSGVGWAPINGTDLCTMVAGRSSASGTNNLAGYPIIGNISFYIGSSAEQAYRIQPYLVGMTAQIQTDAWYDLVARRSGVDYINALVRRGRVLEHYVYDDLRDRFLLAHYVIPPDSFVYTNTVANVFECAHSSSGFPTGDITTAAEYAQDFYGFMVAHFPGGAPQPREIIRAMQFHMLDPNGWRSSKKEIYPPWTRGEYGMSDTTIAGLATTQEADGTELIPAVSGGAAKSISTKTLRAYSSPIWTAKTAGNVVGSLTGGAPLSTSMTIKGSSNAYQLVPFSITEEQRSSISDALLRINRLNNSTSTADTIYAAFYDAETGLLLSQAHNGLVFTPGSDGVLTLTIPNIGKYPSRFLVGLCSGVLGGEIGRAHV